MLGLLASLCCSPANTVSDSGKAPSDKKEGSLICRYRIIVPKRKMQLKAGPLQEWPPQDVGELWLDPNGGRFVYRYFGQNQFGWPEGVYYRTFDTLKGFKGIPAPSTGTENTSPTLMAAAGNDGKTFWLAGPLGVRRYHSINALHARIYGQFANLGSHEWYDLALLHQMFRHLDNLSWDLDGLRKSLDKSAFAHRSIDTPADENGVIPPSANGYCYVFAPSSRSDNDNVRYIRSGGLWQYHLLLDGETPSIRSCYVSEPHENRTGPPYNRYFLFVRHLFVRQSDTKVPSGDIFKLDPYVPVGASVEEFRDKD
jgi:hypothetical protein